MFLEFSTQKTGIITPCVNSIVNVMISGDINNLVLTVDSDLSEVSVTTSQFTFTCISTGGPATTVTWTRDSVTVLEDGDTYSLTTKLTDTETAQYIHTLTVTGRLGGLYTCTVANDKPSEAMMSLPIDGNIDRLICWLLMIIYILGTGKYHESICVTSVYNTSYGLDISSKQCMI